MSLPDIDGKNGYTQNWIDENIDSPNLLWKMVEYFNEYLYVDGKIKEPIDIELYEVIESDEYDVEVPKAFIARYKLKE